MPPPASSAAPSVRVFRVRAAQPVREELDALAAEEPLEIRVNARRVAVTMRTPGRDEDLVRGFLVSEGLVRDPSAIEAVHVLSNPGDPDAGNVANATVREGAFQLDGWDRHMFAASSCGVCGKASLEALRIVHAPVPDPATPLDRAIAYALPDRLRAAQALFERTGGLHASGLFTMEGGLVAFAEDVGRHNAADKVLGGVLRERGEPPADHVLLVSGRIGFEIVAKAVALRTPIVLAVGAPSSLAVSTAEELNVTLVGFLRGDAFNVYTHPERIR